MSWDTVVIGSGPGGLTAAVALARAGQKVLVLEQHYLPGGWTHSFTLGGHRWSPGVHYIGDLEEGGGIRALFEGLGLGPHLHFNELHPDGYDHVLVGDERFDVPKGEARYIERLVARFPHEEAGIRRYFATIDHVVADIRGSEDWLEGARVLALPFKAPHLMRWGLSTLGALLDKTIHDPLLRAILSAQCGNHGLPPSRVSLPLHAAMAAHYYDGGFYPRGGAKAIPGAYIKVLRQYGGEIRVRTRVASVLVDRGRAVGVELEGGERIHARDVVSNADPAITYGKLLPAGVAEGQRRKVRRMDYSPSVVSVFAAVDMDLKKLGYDSGNYWSYRTTDVAGVYERGERELPPGPIQGIFLAVTTLKDPGHQRGTKHTLEMFTLLPYAPFERWRGTEHGERGADYEGLKRSLQERMLDAAERVIPGLRDHLTFIEVGTPLTNDFYCETHRGACYGTAKTPLQLGPFSFSSRSPVKHLHLCGASTFSHGVGGAAMSGLFAAKLVLGLRRATDCLGPPDGTLTIHPADGDGLTTNDLDRTPPPLSA